MIKNWTVITERIKNRSDGFIVYLNYLKSAEHDNHTKTKIVNFKDAEKDFLYFTMKNCSKKDELNRKKGGRKVESYAQSFVFSLPPEIQPTNQEWSKIYHYVKENLREFLGCSNECFYGNFHIQETNNSHMNLLISRCDTGGTLIEKLDKSATVYASKNAFNSAVKKVMNVEPKDYVTKTAEEPQKKRLKPWQMKTTRRRKKKVVISKERFKTSIEESKSQEISKKNV